MSKPYNRRVAQPGSLPSKGPPVARMYTAQAPFGRRVGTVPASTEIGPVLDIAVQWYPTKAGKQYNPARRSDVPWWALDSDKEVGLSVLVPAPEWDVSGPRPFVWIGITRGPVQFVNEVRGKHFPREILSKCLDSLHVTPAVPDVFERPSIDHDEFISI